mmetsp:Transcript_109601/g.194377  ORF Transcript_109601/g.194377 Transcript_109601/m.194377 type:complete len:300 (-) Transcript_109601:127-1026(-)
MNPETGIDPNAADPLDVLNFWFKNTWGTEKLKKVQHLPLWFGGELSICHFAGSGFKTIMRPISPEQRDELDQACARFIPLIKAAGRGELVGQLWSSHDGMYARMLLCDQLSRNCFRGTADAFTYDAAALQIWRQIWDQELCKDYHVPQVMFFITVVEHSEALDVQALVEPLIKYFKAKQPRSLPLSNMYSAAREHKAVVDRFGRFPHRNTLLGRDSTAEEQAWLADVKKLPMWAKSQSPAAATDTSTSTAASDTTASTAPTVTTGAGAGDCFVWPMYVGESNLCCTKKRKKKNQVAALP